MKIEFLLRNKKTLDVFEKSKPQDGIERKKGVYKVNKGNMYFLTYRMLGNNLECAHQLSEFRDSLPSSNDARLIVDEPSIKYNEVLYKYMSEFEVKLRQALTLAICADEESFDNEFISEFDQKDLGDIYAKYLFNSDFADETQRYIRNRHLNKTDAIEYLNSIDEGLPWDDLFDSEDLSTTRTKFSKIRNARNDVMHFHRISKNEYLAIKKLMMRAIGELDSYIDAAKENIEDPKPRADRAKRTLNRIYANQEALIRAFEQSQSPIALQNKISSMADYYQSLDFSGISGRAAEVLNSNGVNVKDALATDRLSIYADYASAIKKIDTERFESVFSLAEKNMPSTLHSAENKYAASLFGVSTSKMFDSGAIRFGGIDSVANSAGKSISDEIDKGKINEDED